MKKESILKNSQIRQSDGRIHHMLSTILISVNFTPNWTRIKTDPCTCTLTDFCEKSSPYELGGLSVWFMGGDGVWGSREHQE